MQATLPIYYYVLSLNDLGINKACKNNNSLRDALKKNKQDIS